MRKADLIQRGDWRRLGSGLFYPFVVLLTAAFTGYLVTDQSRLSLGALIFFFLIFLSLIFNPKIFVYLLVVSIPFSAFELFPLEKLIGSVGHVSVHSSHILAVILIFAAVVHAVPRTGEVKVGATGKAVLLVVFATFISVIGVYQAYYNFIEYFKTMTNMLLFAMLYFAFTNTIKRQDTIFKIIKIWIVVSLLVALYGLYQLLGHLIPIFPLIPGTDITEYVGVPRVRSILIEPVELSKCLLYPTLFLFVLVAERQSFPFKTLKRSVLALLLLLTALMLSFSLTAYLCFSFFLLFFAFSRGIFRKSALPFLMMTAILIVVVFTDMGQIFLTRFSSVSSLEDSSTLWRIQTLSVAWQEFLKYPLFGIGAGNFQSYTATGIFPEAIFHYKAPHSDTLVFQIMAELGVVGIVAMVAFFGIQIRAIRKVMALNKSRDLNYHVSRGLCFIILTYMSSTLFVSGWLEFWIWVNFSIIGSWVLLENLRLKMDRNA